MFFENNGGELDLTEVNGIHRHVGAELTPYKLI